MTATAEAIRDRVIALVTALTPTTQEKVRFVPFRNELDADFVDAMTKNPQLRCFQARDLGDDQPPEVSNTLVEERLLQLELMVAYPQNNRFGSKNALGRDDALVKDWKLIDFAIGICGGGNFSGTNDCTPMGCTKTVERVGKVDLLVVRAQFRFWCATQ